MPEIGNLANNDEIIGEVNWDAPEQGAFQPRLEAGSDHEFIFELEEEPWTEREFEGKPIKGVAYKATTTLVDQSSGEESEVTIRFQKADFFQTQKMKDKGMNSQGAELLRAMGIHLEGPLTWDMVKQAFREADGKARFTATVGWNFYCKTDKVNVRTHNPRKNDHPWPRSSAGYERPVSCPVCGQQGYGREEISRFRLPKKAA